jgi:hypothetical protein
MKPHIKIYLDHFGYAGDEFIPCECCGKKAVDINHVVARGRGGDPTGKKDIIENLQAVCRDCHNKYGDNPNWFVFLVKAHATKLRVNWIELLDKLKSLR